MPVEAAFGHTEGAGELRDRDGGDPSGRDELKGGVFPVGCGAGWDTSACTCRFVHASILIGIDNQVN
jgi:hypothetical protein